MADLARRNGFELVTSGSQLASPGGQEAVGLFAPDDLPVRLRGENGREAESPRPSLLNRLHRYLGSVTLPGIMLCEPNPAYGGRPRCDR